ncbi:MAG: ABC transporter substrate-binding protein [Acidimicrobiales bacterium]
MRVGGRLALLAVAVALAASACAGEGPSRGGAAGLSGRTTTITFSIAVSGEEKAAIQELISRFENRTSTDVGLDLLTRFRDPPRTRVNLVTSMSSSDLVSRLRQGDPSERGPHLFAQDNLALKPLVDEGLVEDLSQIEVPGAVIPSMIPPRFDGKPFFLPFRPNVRLTYLRKGALGHAGADPPRTVEDLRNMAQRLAQEMGKAPLTLSLAEGDPAAVTIAEWVASFGGDPLVLNDDGSLRAFEYLQGLWKDGLIARESLFAKFDTEIDNLQSGRAAVAQNWSFTSAVLAQNGRLDDFRVDPGWKGPVRAVHVIGGDVLGLPRGVTGEQRAAALGLADFLMSQEAQELLAEKNTWASIRTDAYGTVPEEVRETFSAIRQALADGWFRPSVSYWPDVTAAMTQAVDRILLRQEPAKAVLDDLHGQIAAAALEKGAVYPPGR